ncbi:hypothetical protein LEP1GSC133_1175 [Leptospira borgpetersenii serovar Pomona str. 200901868]|uniref:Uncharacterized protein n=1 Tax=Leptospira borgpetersenii serovar Pomona str. 200901868 TaxID=1192866 RepID=M6WKQ9_LEPBO|nr:hypothetical protein LEP1GSC133_1175 [Leptospira borgpetersenii serovar Pomona str. 200901868]
MIPRFFGVCDNRRIHSHKNLSFTNFFLWKKPVKDKNLAA